ncbi:MAG TPA: DUF3617 domain-containing protein [Burkholderiaceae bacterium]|jgi:hypothetical protein
MRVILRNLPVALLFCLALPALAQSIKPGLWEMSQKPELSPEQQAKMDAMQKQMANMPPEQRKMLDQMMASHGVQMNMAGGTFTIKSCISKEQAERNAPPVTDGKQRCTYDVKRGSGTIHTHFVCAESGTEGDSDITLLGNGNGYTNKTRVTHMKNGKPETVTLNGEAHWLGADCGGLKPIEPPKPTSIK